MNKGIAIGSLGLAILGIAIFASGALASVGNNGQFGQNYLPERHAQMMGSTKGLGMMGAQRDQNAGRNFVDKNGDGICDHMQ